MRLSWVFGFDLIYATQDTVFDQKEWGFIPFPCAMGMKQRFDWLNFYMGWLGLFLQVSVCFLGLVGDIG
ncbi:MAG: hypothetical protein R3F23_05530 [Verrucomicrobiia bacterium]